MNISNSEPNHKELMMNLTKFKNHIPQYEPYQVFFIYSKYSFLLDFGMYKIKM